MWRHVHVMSTYAFAPDISKHRYTDITEGKETSYVEKQSRWHTVHNVRSPSLPPFLQLFLLCWLFIDALSTGTAQRSSPHLYTESMVTIARNCPLLIRYMTAGMAQSVDRVVKVWTAEG